MTFTMPATPHFDVLVLGAGAAGMMAAAKAGQRGRSVLVVDHAKAPGEKIRISGGGRCNFTNLYATVQEGGAQFLSDNPRFALSALARFTPTDFIALIESYGIAYHEKTLGQLFCDGSATQVVNMLTSEMSKAGVTLKLQTSLESIEKTAEGFSAKLSDGPVTAQSFIIASGGKSVPAMGASDQGYRLATQFALNVLATRPALVPLTFDAGALVRIGALSGVSTTVQVSCGANWFREALLFTHRGLSGPAILQISSYWRETQNIVIDLRPGTDVYGELRSARQMSPKLDLRSVLSLSLPRRLAQFMEEVSGASGQIGNMSDQTLKTVAQTLKAWTLKPMGSEGYRTAEVTLGGVDTAELDSATMQARKVPGLYVIGEVVDVTGWLGGYNFQWAWASGWAAGQVA